MDTLTTTIKREFLEEIVAGRKRVEYREIKPYWTDKLATVRPPFKLRLINGMSATAPEATVEIHRVTKNNAEGCYELHISRVLDVKNLAGRPAQPKGEVVRAYFFLWNPTLDTESFRGFEGIMKKARAGKPYARRWLCPSKQPRPGDTAYLQRTGATNNGVFARGIVASDPFIDDYGERVVKLELDEFLPIGLEISRDKIRTTARFEGHWDPYASGNIIPPALLRAIERLWQARSA